MQRMSKIEGTQATLAGYWDSSREVELNGQISPDPGGGVVRIRLAYDGHDARWISAPLAAGGLFAVRDKAPADSFRLSAVALFEGNKAWSEARSPVCISGRTVAT